MAWDLDYNVIERGVRTVLDELGKSKLKDAKVFLACFNDFEPERREEAEALRIFFDAGLGNSLYAALKAPEKEQARWLKAALQMLTMSASDSGMDEAAAKKLLTAVARGAELEFISKINFEVKPEEQKEPIPDRQTEPAPATEPQLQKESVSESQSEPEQQREQVSDRQSEPGQQREQVSDRQPEPQPQEKQDAESGIKHEGGTTDSGRGSGESGENLQNDLGSEEKKNRKKWIGLAGAAAAILVIVLIYMILPKSHSITVHDGTSAVSSAKEGETIRIQADEPDDSAYVFSGWECTPENIVISNDVSDDSGLSASFTMPDNDVTIEAKYEEMPSYSITVKNGEATVSSAKQGEIISIKANEPGSSDYTFAGWECTPEDIVITEEASDNTGLSARFTMPEEDVIIEAKYEEIPSYSLTINSEYIGEYKEGDLVQIEADVPEFEFSENYKVFVREDYIYVFAYWEADDEDVILDDIYAQETSFIMPGHDVVLGTVIALAKQTETPEKETTAIQETEIAAIEENTEAPGEDNKNDENQSALASDITVLKMREAVALPLYETNSSYSYSNSLLAVEETSELEVIEFLDDGWYHVQLAGQTGYVRGSDYTTTEGRFFTPRAGVGDSNYYTPTEEGELLAEQWETVVKNVFTSLSVSQTAPDYFNDSAVEAKAKLRAAGYESEIHVLDCYLDYEDIYLHYYPATGKGTRIVAIGLKYSRTSITQEERQAADEIGYLPEGIHLGDSREQVLAVLGITEEMMQWLPQGWCNHAKEDSDGGWDSYFHPSEEVDSLGHTELSLGNVSFSFNESGILCYIDVTLQWDDMNYYFPDGILRR